MGNFGFTHLVLILKHETNKVVFKRNILLVGVIRREFSFLCWFYRKKVWADRFSITKNDGAFNSVLQLAYVAWPAVAVDAFQCWLVEFETRLGVSF